MSKQVQTLLKKKASHEVQRQSKYFWQHSDASRNVCLFMSLRAELQFVCPGVSPPQCLRTSWVKLRSGGAACGWTSAGQWVERSSADPTPTFKSQQENLQVTGPQIGLLRLSKKQQVNNVRTPTRRKTLFNLSRHPHVIIMAGKTPQFYRSSPNSTMVES